MSLLTVSAANRRFDDVAAFEQTLTQLAFKEDAFETALSVSESVRDPTHRTGQGGLRIR
jgi:hypothetical protein